MPKMLNEMNCLEALEALEEGLEALNLPEFRLIQTYIVRARVAHTEELEKAAKGE